MTAKEFLPDFLARHDVIRLLEIARVDLACGEEALDLDRPRVLGARDGSDLLIFLLIPCGGFICVRLVASGGHRRRTFAPRRLDQFHRAGRRTCAARPLDIAVLNQHKLVLADLVTPRLARRIDRFAGDGIDQFVPKPMTGAPVDLPERDPLRHRGCGVKRDRTRNERQLQVAFPEGAGRGHEKLQTQRGHEGPWRPNGPKAGEFQGVRAVFRDYSS